MNEANAVDVAGIDRQLADIDAQEKRIVAKLERLHADIEKARKARNELRTRRERLQLCRLIGKPVKKLPKWNGTPHATDSMTGILLRVKRTYAVVDYGDAGRWDIPIGWLQAADEQGGLFHGGAVLFV